MYGKKLKQKLNGGGKVFGMFLHYITNPTIVERFPPEGLDFVIVNTEHNALDFQNFQAMQIALHEKGIACLMRISSRSAEDVYKACDSFSDGVVVPYVEDIEELKQLVAAAKYRPLQGEALERLINKGEWPSLKTKEYVEQKCDNTFFCAMIESREAIDHLDDICSVGGIDSFLVGPNDLTNSLGIPEERDNPLFIEQMQKIISVADKYGIAAGAHLSDLRHVERLVKQGGRFIPYSNDGLLLQKGMLEFLSHMDSLNTK